jgi:hypothetical protein
MNTKLVNVIGAICKVRLAGMLLRTSCWLNKNFCPGRGRPPTIEDYLFKISRVTGKSEYDIFRKSAENWPVSSEKIDQDFKRYLDYQSVPHYVTDFVRKNKKHIDALHMPRF